MRTARQTERVFGLSAVQIKTCANCGKQFPIVSPDYAYKIEKVKRSGGERYSWFCSYACMRTIQKPLEVKRKAQFEEKVKKDSLSSLKESEEHSRQYYASKAAKQRLNGAQQKQETVEEMVGRMRKADEERRKKRRGSKKPCLKENS